MRESERERKIVCVRMRVVDGGGGQTLMPAVTDRCLPIYVFRHRLFRNDDRVSGAGTNTFKRTIPNQGFISFHLSPR